MVVQVSIHKQNQTYIHQHRYQKKAYEYYRATDVKSNESQVLQNMSQSREEVNTRVYSYSLIACPQLQQSTKLTKYQNAFNNSLKHFETLFHPIYLRYHCVQLFAQYSTIRSDAATAENVYNSKLLELVISIKFSRYNYL